MSPPLSVDGYPYAARVPTRWNDNDVYGHVNNTVHYLAMDTVVNAWLIDHGLDVEGGPQIGLVVESGCRYLAPVTYPDALVLGLRIARLGSSSVRWQIGMDRESDRTRVAEGHFVHVFVDRQSRRPAPVPSGLRSALQALVIDGTPAEGQDEPATEI